MAKTIGVVLAGGESRRMGRHSKPFVLFKGKRLIEHGLERLAAQVDVVVVNLNDTRRHTFNEPVVPDLDGMSVGPMGGLLSVFEWVKEHHPDANRLVTIPCDMPLLPRDYVARMTQQLKRKEADCGYASSKGQGHYVCAIWPMRAHGIVQARVAAGDFRVADCLKELGALQIEFSYDSVNPFSDLNSLEKLREIESLSITNDTQHDR